jgi:hypothetical protein
VFLGNDRSAAFGSKVWTDCLEWVIFGNEDGPPVKSGLPSKAEGPASEVYRAKDDLADASPTTTVGLRSAAEASRQARKCPDSRFLIGVWRPD